MAESDRVFSFEGKMIVAEVASKLLTLLIA